MSRAKGIYSLPAYKRPKCATPLQEWIDQVGVSYYWIAKKLKVHPQVVTKWARGQVLLGLINAFKIERLTKGAVPAVSWLATEIGKVAWNTDYNWRAYDRANSTNCVAYMRRRRKKKKEENERISQMSGGAQSAEQHADGAVHADLLRGESEVPAQGAQVAD